MTSELIHRTLNHALSGPNTLSVGLIWWFFGMTLAVSYGVFVYSRFRGKTDSIAEEH
jgi:cytochrome bd ubiquinol oxidase subunit II